jgi:hypothetical protein
MVSSGLSRQRTVLLLYAISLLALLAGLLSFIARGLYLPVFLGALCLIVIVIVRRQKISPNTVGRMLNESVGARQDTKNALKLRDWFALEAVRADTGEHLWSDFQFVLRKIGFCRASLRIAKAERSFYIPHSNHDKSQLLWQETHEINSGIELTLYADKDYFSERQFLIISDIAAEAWTGAATQWRLLNDAELTFDATAKDPETYREQKSRSLYRPTY